MSNIINKVVYNGNTLIDLTDLDVTAGDVVSGVTFIMKDGTKAVGTITIPTKTSDLVNDSGFITSITSELVTDTKSGSVSIPASDVGTATIDMTKSGYSLIGVVGIKTSGSGSSMGYIYSFFINNSTNIVVYFRNSSATARNYTVEVTGLYLKNAS